MPREWCQALNQVLADWDGRGLVVSPDVDGILSAALLANHRGARVVGVYTTSHLVLLDGSSRADARGALWLDHDISHPGVRCVGQHLILHAPGDKLPRRHWISFNPNHHYGQTYQESFRGQGGRTRDKYPFGTVHFLMEALRVPRPAVGSKPFALLAHADGTWATALDYEPNFRIWEELMFGAESVVEPLSHGYTSSPTNLTVHSGIVADLLRLGVASRGSREGTSRHVPSAWQHIQGHQSVSFNKRWDHAAWLEKFRAVAGYLSDAMHWKLALPSKVTEVVSGTVETPYPDAIPQGGFDAYMQEKHIFSHAIKSRRMLRYTTGIDLSG